MQFPKRPGDHKSAAFLRIIEKHGAERWNRFEIADGPGAADDVTMPALQVAANQPPGKHGFFIRQANRRSQSLAERNSVAPKPVQ